jgi:hypothetical protein
MTIKQPITIPAIYTNDNWTLPITYYSEDKYSKVTLELNQSEIQDNNTNSQKTKTVNILDNVEMKWQRFISDVNVYEYIINQNCFNYSGLVTGVITEVNTKKDVIVTPLYISIIPNILEQEISFNFGKTRYTEKLSNLVSSIWLDSGKEVMTYKTDECGNMVATFGNYNCVKLFKFSDNNGDFLPSDSFVKLTRINEDASNTVIEHYKVLNSYVNEHGAGIDKFTKDVIHNKPISYVKIDTSTLESGNYVVQAWYSKGETLYKSNPTLFEI